MYRPPYLQPGDQVAVISPAGAIEPAVLEEAVKTLRSWELEPVIGKHAAAKYGYFAGNDNQRAEDMQWALDTEDIRAIFCTRGGYGSMRIVEQLDYSIFQGSPKWLVGFSDITVFHAKLNTLGIESMHAAMPKSFPNTEPEALKRTREFLFGQVNAYQLPPHPLNQPGIVEAELTGGNLTLLHCIHSSNLECKHQTPILFIEDIGENLYAIDRMLQSLKLAEKFTKIQGLIAGDFSEMKGLNFGKDAYTIIHELLEEYQYPVCFGFPAGHSSANYPLIMGSTVHLEVHSEGTTISFCND
ncbi:LD-carboxypeptidase [Odoribacter sp. Z80]|uniref:S66 peptidase family protein n=1 Tax=Odoribacter sp. Z80 TaxID=2304575 RepID=UPI00137B774C|nr:LD-carboxypeptidase [Odoribacter sp. Z80]NCE71747.1 LD-carboxypeptidase [Odoribacter sp. Z80]